MQILKLLNHRIQKDPESAIQICLQSKDEQSQLLMLNWLGSHWAARHYRQIWDQLNLSLKEEKDAKYITPWIEALIKSHAQQAYNDLVQFFKPNRFLKSIFRPKVNLDTKTKRLILNSIS